LQGACAVPRPVAHSPSHPAAHSHTHFLIERELNARLAGRLPFAGFPFAACRLNGTKRNKNYNIAAAADDAMEMEGKQQAQLQPHACTEKKLYFEEIYKSSRKVNCIMKAFFFNFKEQFQHIMKIIIQYISWTF